MFEFSLPINNMCKLYSGDRISTSINVFVVQQFMHWAQMLFRSTGVSRRGFNVSNGTKQLQNTIRTVSC